VNIGGSGTAIQPTAQAALVPTAPGNIMPTQVATVVRRADTLTSGNSGFPLWIFIPVAGMLVIGGGIVLATRKK
jgi:hypothetical protein